ncbi:myotubularin-related protein 6-like isoform X3 [Argiope bruennichi]|uniref:myotubularin-related protein 6-like isoform X3 n=1 Tax=Argiope bruennichi TaxID=94029 RepID=UPI0024948691|nr:myotubularin-related protein 6-like isoform X3 [Argiope bruennichi]
MRRVSALSLKYLRHIEKVRMLDRFNSKKPNVGTLHLTATHLIFIDPEGKKEAWILHTHIATVIKLPISTSGSPLQIRCKNFLCVTFVIPKERDSHDIYTSLLKLSQPINIQELYCFHYTASNEDQPKRSGWNKFDLQAEFSRMGVPNRHWVLTNINKDYEICDTYPKYLYVPSSASSTILVGSSRFRSRGRLPVLSYLHRNMAAICRCSQPLSGFSARCVEDEQLLNCILKSSPNSDFMYVVDTRPKINAMANKAAGKGYENEDFYKNIKFQFFGIENIHVMRNSLQKLVDACELKVPSMNAFLSGLESSGWLRHVKTVLEASAFIADALEKGTTVLVHCSDGWDRTAQTCSLAALLQDPYYRTITGFQALIEKEWLAFGHKFTDRCGLIQGDPKEVAPVFTQFIDAVWQLTQQFPSSFQFNERFLLTIHDHVYSCQFGTFIGNCEKDRVDLRLSERTYSLWGYLMNHLSEFLNPLYKREVDDVLHPSLAPQAMRFWRGMYNRFENGVHPREPLGDMLVAAKDHISSLEDHILQLQKRISQFKAALNHAETPSKDMDSSMVDSGLAEDFKKKLDSGKIFSAGDVADSGFENGNINNENDSPDGSNGNSIFSQLLEELDSVALEWKTLRNVRECICSTPFDHFSRKFHCWSCGDVFCVRCIDKRISLKGHYHQRPVPVCRHCYKELMRTNSIDS